MKVEEEWFYPRKFRMLMSEDWKVDAGQAKKSTSMPLLNSTNYICLPFVSRFH